MLPVVVWSIELTVWNGCRKDCPLEVWRRTDGVYPEMNVVSLVLAPILKWRKCRYDAVVLHALMVDQEA